jgi:hypothetical protein
MQATMCKMFSIISINLQDVFMYVRVKRKMPKKISHIIERTINLVKTIALLGLTFIIQRQQMYAEGNCN